MSTPALEALLELQALDTAADQARHRLANLPEQAEADAIAAERRALGERRAAVLAERDALAERQSALESDLAGTEARARTVSARLYGGEVSASRDLQAMQADLEGLHKRASDLEDQVLAILDEREPFDAAVDAADEEDAALAGREADAAARRDAAAGRLGEEVADLAARRGPLLGAVPADLAATYERLRARLGGVGAARLVGDHCGGCHLVLPATELDRLRHLPEDALVTCEQCGRILVRP